MGGEMNAEQLEQYQEIAKRAGYSSWNGGMAGKAVLELLAHVAALTAERDEARALHRFVCAKFDEAVAERDALAQQLQQAQRELADFREQVEMDNAERGIFD